MHRRFVINTGAHRSDGFWAIKGRDDRALHLYMCVNIFELPPRHSYIGQHEMPVILLTHVNPVLSAVFYMLCCSKISDTRRESTNPQLETLSGRKRCTHCLYAYF